jgi:hypothetical protein
VSAALHTSSTVQRSLYVLSFGTKCIGVDVMSACVQQRLQHKSSRLKESEDRIRRRVYGMQPDMERERAEVNDFQSEHLRTLAKQRQEQQEYEQALSRSASHMDHPWSHGNDDSVASKVRHMSVQRYQASTVLCSVFCRHRAYSTRTASLRVCNHPTKVQALAKRNAAIEDQRLNQQQADMKRQAKESARRAEKENAEDMLVSETGFWNLGATSEKVLSLGQARTPHLGCCLVLVMPCMGGVMSASLADLISYVLQWIPKEQRPRGRAKVAHVNDGPNTGRDDFLSWERSPGHLAEALDAPRTVAPMSNVSKGQCSAPSQARCACMISSSCAALHCMHMFDPDGEPNRNQVPFMPCSTKSMPCLSVSSLQHPDDNSKLALVMVTV